MEHTKLIAMRKNLGLGHKGDILLTTQERVDTNQEPITKDIIDKEYAEELIRRWNAFEKDGLVDELVVACEIGLNAMNALKEMAEKLSAPDRDKTQHQKHIEFVEAAIAKAT